MEWSPSPQCPEEPAKCVTQDVPAETTNRSIAPCKTCASLEGDESNHFAQSGSSINSSLNDFLTSESGYNATRPSVREKIVGKAEALLVSLHKAEANCRRGSELAAQFADLFVRLPLDAVPRVRASLDSGLVFRQDGRAADLRGLVFEDLGKRQRNLVLSMIYKTCEPPPQGTPGFVVMSDVDDTLFPATDALHIGGSDRSWHLDGRLYPGVSRMHRELRSGIRDAYGPDYSVLLTARPPFMVKSMPDRLKRIAGLQNPRLSILPGSNSIKEVAKNFFKVLAGRFDNLGELKVVRVLEYSVVFPDYAGRFVFIGDDGQGDFDAAMKMLSLKIGQGQPLGMTLKHGESSRLAVDSSMPLLAFVAIHSVLQKDQATISCELRNQRINELRAQNPPIPVEKSVCPGPPGAVRHRFFYFDDYSDLAEQLAAAGWIEPMQRDAITRSFFCDHTPEPMKEVARCDYLALRASLRARAPSLEEADEAESASFEYAKQVLPTVARTHLRLAQLPEHYTGLHLQVVNLQLTSNDVCWPGNGAVLPPCFFHNINSSQIPHATAWQWDVDPAGFFNLPWPCDALCHGAARAVIDVGSVARCFVVVDSESDEALFDGQEITVTMIDQSSEPCIGRPLGNMTIKVFWDQSWKDAMTIEDALR